MNPMWICRKCGVGTMGSDRECWKCGERRDE